MVAVFFAAAPSAVYSNSVSLSQFLRFGFCCALAGSAFAGCHDSSAAQPPSAAPMHSIAPQAASTSGAGAAAALARVSDAQSGPDAGAMRSLPGSGAVVADAGAAPPAAPVASATPAAADSLSLLDAEGEPLPQTDARPKLDSASFQRRIAALASAITSGDAEPAAFAFFPLVAYAQVKDVAKPERDYRFRLLANFKRDVLDYHHALGQSAAEAKLTGITVSEGDAKWMAPGSEGNKLGYYRVLRSKLHFALPAGRSRDFELTSLISWRGEWYVVHLHGFK